MLNLNFEHWGILLPSLISALMNVGISIYVMFWMASNRTNRTFSLFAILLAVLQFCDGFMHMSIDATTAMLWARSSNALLLFICPIGLLFTLRFTGWYKKIRSSVLYTLLFVPAIVFQLITAANINPYIIEKSPEWRWVLNPQPSYTTNIIYGWIVGVAFLMLSFLWGFYFLEKKTAKKQQTLLLSIGFTLPFITGVTTEVIFPLILNINDIPLTSISISTFSLLSIIAIKKYNLLDYSPRHQWENIIDVINEGLLIVDNSHRIMFSNKKFFEITGHTWDEIKNKTTQELYYSDNESNKSDFIEKIPGTTGQIQRIIKTKEGKRKILLVSWSPYLSRKGCPIGLIKICTDITQIKNMETTLSHNNSRLEEAQKIAKVGSWEINLESKKSIWSTEACQIYGLSITENHQTFESWLSFIHPDDIVAVKEHVKNSKIGFRGASFKHRIICRDGTIKHLLSVSKFELNQDGVPLSLFGICHDITEQHKAQQAIIENEKNTRDFASQLNVTIENERSYIAREIHDEFGQYLAGIKYGLSSLKKQFKGDEKNLQRFDSLINDMEACQQSVKRVATKLRPGVLDTLGLIHSMEWFVKDFQKKSEIKINLSIKNGINKSYDSQTSICFFRICQEALTNISKHAEASEVSVEIRETIDGLFLVVSDNGKGIPSNKMSNPFSMGLLGMKERANLIGANFQINSKENIGTTIKLELNRK